MVALPTSPQAQHQSKWPDLNRNGWPVLSESAVGCESRSAWTAVVRAHGDNSCGRTPPAASYSSPMIGIVRLSRDLHWRSRRERLVQRPWLLRLVSHDDKKRPTDAIRERRRS